MWGLLVCAKLWAGIEISGVKKVPLSEDEERILSEIEQGFYAEDPDLARQVGETTLYRHSLRSIRLAALGFLGGLGVLVVGLGTAVWLAFLGFLGMIAAMLVISESLGKIGRAGFAEVSASMGNRSLRSMFGSPASRMRERFRREDD